MPGRRLSPRDRDRRAPLALLAEAGRDIAAASLAIRRRPFRTLADRLEQPQQGAPADAETIYWVRRSVLAWGRRLPWRAKCFEQGLAAAWMLRRRGLAYELHYGANGGGGALKAHVWVTSGGAPVVGCENAADFSRLASFAG
ncbi:lasso peptide biosynthesis B2 protein [Sphingomonas mesophila]|uniref:lasso peptide biosynthesis B2 protein n=1 Tax=Sphingomonas mesophila TaxID=2303576 RepID=UPI0013C371DE|nr:lasso peptide biosynthesis B2 protein [Sphingomonas mesophila]